MINQDKNKYKFLVVEDNTGDYFIVENLLKEQIAAPSIIRAGSFKQAREILSFDEHTFDVILLDLTLPDKSTDKLVQEMLQLVTVCPIIILTGNADTEFSVRSITRGISDYLIKDDLTATVLYKSIVYAIERKKSASIVEGSEKRYSDLFHSSPQPKWLFDPLSLKFVQVNKATIDLYGYSEKEFLNMTLMDIKLDQNVGKVEQELSKGNTGDGVIRRTFRHHKKSGEPMEVEIYSSPIIIGNKSLISVIAIDVTEKNLRRKNELKAIVKAQEEERYEIGSELHDNVCQLLAASQMYLGMLKTWLPPQGLEHHEHCRKNVALALQEIHNLSHRLAPSFYSESTIEEDFQKLFDTFNAEKKLEISLHLDEAVRNYHLTPDLKLNLYRILQEQLGNIQKYANATIIHVDLLMDDQTLSMKIADNGVGFNTEQIKNGIGLANIKRRAELLAGTFDLHSSPGAGCRIIIHVPLLKTA